MTPQEDKTELLVYEQAGDVIWSAPEKGHRLAGGEAERGQVTAEAKDDHPDAVAHKALLAGFHLSTSEESPEA